MKSLTITFHASHNHGSMLQAFALQQTLNKVCGGNEILNFRTKRQERMMRVFTFRGAIGPILKDISHLFFYRQLKKRYTAFEEFISKYLHTTEVTYRTLEELQRANLQYDLFVAGSDQIWNPRPEDFDWAYYLPFVQGRKVSYAASMGPCGILSKKEQIKINDFLKDFYAISVREQGTEKAIKNISQHFDVQVNIDPVFLLDAKEWCNKLPLKGNNHGRYIFFYTLFADKEMINMVKSVSKKMGLPVITPCFSNINDVFAPFEKQLASGPIEFLHLLSNAQLVITSSFHGTAFSMIFHKRLISLRGLTDNRIGNLLRLVEMENCAVGSMADIARVLTEEEINWRKVDAVIERERSKSLSYLKSCVE